MLPSFPLWLVMILAGIAYALITAIMTVLAHRSHMRTRRHDLLVNIKTRRLQYELQLIERQKALQANYADRGVEIVAARADVAGTITPDDAADTPQREAA